MLHLKVRRFLTRKRGFYHALQGVQESLKPGIWTLSRGNLAKNITARIPQHLRETSRANIHTDYQTTALGRAAKRLAANILGVGVLWVPARDKTRKVGYVSAKRLGGLILFDFEASEVVRIQHSEPSQRYLMNRDILTQYLPVPDYYISHDRHIVELLVSGRAMSELPTNEKLIVLHQLFSKYELLIQEKKHPASPRTPSATGSLHYKYQWPTVIAHGDLHPGNIIVDARCVNVIDLDNSAELPFFYDVLYLLMSDTELSALLVEGAGARLLRRLDNGAGYLPVPNELADRLTFILASKIHRDRVSNGGHLRTSAEAAAVRFGHLKNMVNLDVDALCEAVLSNGFDAGGTT